MVPKVLSIILLSLAYANCYTGSKVYRVSISDDSQLKALTDAVELDIWRRDLTSADFLVERNQISLVNKLLAEKNIPYTIKIDDVQSLISEERKKTEKSYGHFNSGTYNKLDAIYRWMEYTAKTHKATTKLETIGFTEGNKPIKVLKINSSKYNSPAIFIEAGMHGREWASIAAVLRVMEKMIQNRGDLPKSVWHTDIYFLPVFNPDGYEYTHTRDRFWRKNRHFCGKCYGVDLSRNFDVNFGGTGTTGDSCRDTYRGLRASSERETQHFTNYIKKIRSNLKAYVSVHSYGGLILVPYSYEKGAHPSNYKDLVAVGQSVAKNMKSQFANYKVGTLPELIHPVSGTPFDWVKGKLGIKYSYGIELRDINDTGFLMPSEYIKKIADELYEGICAIISNIK